MPPFIGRLFQSSTLDAVKLGIRATNLRHQAIANNIANVDTPKYQRATVHFEDQLKRALQGQGVAGRRTHPEHFIIGGPEAVKEVRPRVQIDNETRFRADKNNVNIDNEMADLAENTNKNIQFTEMISRRYSGLNSTIRTLNSV